MTTKPLFYCEKHTSEPATFGCDSCKRTYCGSCTKVRTFTYGRLDTCPACEEPLLPIEIPVEGKDDTPGAALISCLRFPIEEPDGRWTLFGGGLAFGLFVGLTGVGVAGHMARVIAIAALIGYAEKAIRRTADGKVGVPDWPQWTHWVDWMATLVRSAIGLAVSFAPAVYLVANHHPTGATQAAVIFGVLYWPMAWIASAMNRSVIGFSPHVVLPALLRTDKFYWVAVPFAALLFVGLPAVTVLTYQIPWILRPVLSIGVYAIATYLMLVLGRLLGLVYLRTNGRFGW